MAVRVAELNAGRNRDEVLEFKPTPVTNKHRQRQIPPLEQFVNFSSYCCLSSYAEVRNSFLVYGLGL